MQTRRAIRGIIAVAAIVAVGGGCVGEPESQPGVDDTWTLGSDTHETTSPDTDEADTGVTEPDSGMQECPPGTRYNPVAGECVDPSRDSGAVVETGTVDVGVTDTGTPSDTALPPEPVETRVGQTFAGPTVAGKGDTTVRADYGVGLYWKSALSQFHDHSLHRLIGNQKIMDLSRINTKTQQTSFRFSLPKWPAEKFHFYRNYCDKVGQETCDKQGIDDDTPHFALFMLALHEAPENGKASDCTWRDVYGKNRCHYGRAVAQSRTVIVYAYESFSAEDYPVFDNICVADGTTFQKGYNAVRIPNDSAEGCQQIARVVPFPDFIKREHLRVSSEAMFPMLYP